MSAFDPEVASFRRYLRSENKSDNTIRIYTDAAQRLARWLQQQRDVEDDELAAAAGWDEVSADHVRAWIVSLLDSASDGYANNQYRSVQQFFRWYAVEESLPNPMAAMRPPQVPEQPVPVLRKEQLGALLKSCSGRAFVDRRDLAILYMFMEDFFAGLAGRWPAGQEDYHWLVLPDSATRDHLEAQYQELTRRPGLAPVPGRWMHVTVLHAPPVTQLTADQAAQMTALVASQCAALAPFAAVVGPAEAWHGGIVCPVRPGPPLRRLWQITADAAAAVTGGACETRPAVYYPHLTLAYAHDHVDHGPVRVWLIDHAPAPAAMPVTALALVAQQHDRRQITWRPVSQVPLAGNRT
jgi:2'-5' RNA ligase